MDMFGLDFMRNAFVAGGCIALAAGLVGYFVSRSPAASAACSRAWTC